MEQDVLTFDSVHEAHRGYVRGTLSRFGVSVRDLEDLVQEVFALLHRSGSRFELAAQARRWLFQAARRVASNHRRGAARARAREAAAAAPSQWPQPDEVVARAEAGAVVDRFTGGLDPQLRDVFRLSEVEGLGGPEVARRTGANVNTVYARIRAVRRRFAAVVTTAVAIALGLLALAAGRCRVDRVAALEADDDPRPALRGAADRHG